MENLPLRPSHPHLGPLLRMEDLFSAFHPQNEPFLRMVWRRVAWSATMPVCSRPLSACEPVRPSSGGPQRPSPRARAAPAALRARPPLVRRPSAAISAGSRRAIPPCHSICETINAKVFCSPEAIKRIMCIYILCFCPSDMSANTKRRVHKH